MFSAINGDHLLKPKKAICTGSPFKKALLLFFYCLNSLPKIIPTFKDKDI